MNVVKISLNTNWTTLVENRIKEEIQLKKVQYTLEIVSSLILGGFMQRSKHAFYYLTSAVDNTKDKLKLMGLNGD